MVTQIPELDDYINILRLNLKVEDNLKEEICMEIYQNLYAKYNDYLIKGYDIEQSTAYVLKDMGDCVKLAKMFNAVHKEDVKGFRTFRIFYDKRVLLAGVLATLITSYII